MICPRLLYLILLAAPVSVTFGQTGQEWPAYGNDPGGTRYSPLSDINRQSVAKLKVAWTYRTGALSPETRLNEKSAFEATPLLVNNTLYLTTPFNQLIALDPATGQERWKFDPQVDRTHDYSEVTSRGASSWQDRSAKPGTPCRIRVFMGTIDARLIAVDGESGKPCADFGKQGTVDLTADIALKDRGDYQVTSPPAVVGNVIVVGSSIGDNRRYDVERGTVRAFDVRTGQQRWAWDPLPAAEKTGGANAWGVLSADRERDLVFIPTGSASPDFYGGQRPGDNRYANSVVAIRASSGKLVWHYQVVHHDLWDYDVAAQPTLVTVPMGGRKVAAVAVNTKMGHYFLLDRETGKPLLPVEERAVPTSDMPGEQASKSQPIPLNPPLAPQRLRPEDAWGLTEEDRQACREQLSAYRNEGLFTPPSLKGSVFYPGNAGGTAWGGASIDPEHGLMLVNTNRLAFIVRLIPREKLAQVREEVSGTRFRGEFGNQTGTPYAMYRHIFVGPSGLPCHAPPWGALSAVDLATGRIRWEVPLGTTQIPAGAAGNKEPISIEGSVNLGGSLTTAGGLVFIAASRGDEELRAFDVETGKLIWHDQLPASAQATPMTYRSTKDGRQYLVICAGGHGKAGSKMGDYVVAYALK